MLDPDRPHDISVVTTTVGAMEDATRLGREIVARGLAACVQVDPIATSFYMWEGELCAEPEWRLTIKTIPMQLPALEAFFAEEHPYELPQFAVSRMAASKDYGAWVAANAGGGI